MPPQAQEVSVGRNSLGCTPFNSLKQRAQARATNCLEWGRVATLWAGGRTDAGSGDTG